MFGQSELQTLTCNGSIAGASEATGSAQNEVDGSKKPTVHLTHLFRRPPVDVEFQNISYSIGNKKIIKEISGKFRSSELSAIMGPSGAGKSTLMNILAGYKTSNLTGHVLINGKSRNLRSFRKLSCYIMQDDRLLPYLTVREAMLVSANLKLGKDFTSKNKKLIVDEIIDALGLSEAKNTMTVNLSGGQRKRLSVALELVNNPPIMFCDEPTSGLDSFSGFQLISLLKLLARGGRTIICTIHQPSARLFEKFDQLYMLAEGNCIFRGSVISLVPFLAFNGHICPSYHNPADFVMEVACGEHGDALGKLIAAVNKENSRSSQEILASGCIVSVVQPNSDKVINAIIPATSTTMDPYNETSLDENVLINIDLVKNSSSFRNPNESSMNNKDQSIGPSSSLLESSTESVLETHKNQVHHMNGFPTSSWTQFWILLKRTFLSIVRDQTLTQMRLVSHVVVGAIIGTIYYGIGNDAGKIMSNAGCLFFTTLFTMFTALMPTILTFPTEMSVFVREHLNYWYSLKSYYFAKTIADLPFQILFTSVYVIVVYILTAQPLEAERMGMFVLICNLTSLVAQSLGLLIGAGMSVESGSFLGPVSTIPTILFSGFFINFKVIPWYLRWVTYVSYVRFGFEGVMVSVYGMNRKKLECNEMYCHYRNPEKFLQDMSMADADFWVDAGALVFIFISLRIIAYFVLRWRLYRIR